MELTLALEVLNNSVSSKQKEIDSLKLAISILEGKFAPELKVLDNANAEVATKTEENATLIADKEALVNQVDTLTSEKNDLSIQVASLTSEKTNLENQIGNFKPVEITK